MKDQSLSSKVLSSPSGSARADFEAIENSKIGVCAKTFAHQKNACRSSSVWVLAGVLTDPCLVKQGLYSCGTATESHRSFPVSFSGWPLRNQNWNPSSFSPIENRFQFWISGLCSRRHHPSSNDEKPSSATLNKWTVLRTGLIWKLCVVVSQNPIWLLTPTTCLAGQLTWAFEKMHSQEYSWGVQFQALIIASWNGQKKFDSSSTMNIWQ